eukprot:gene17169-23485_t
MVTQEVPEAIRSLKIKTSSVKRTRKEYLMYRTEVEKEQATLEKMKEQGKEFHDLKQQENVLGESNMMIPETRQRLEALLSDLEVYIGANKEEIEGSEELEAANEIIKAVVDMFEE